MKPITEIVAQAEKLKPLPHTAAKLAQVVADEKSTIDDVVETVRYDQALTADILKIANSAFSASSRSIGNVRDAVIRLGGGRILEMVVSKRVRFILKRPLLPYGYDENDLWRHSIASALAAENLGRYVKTRVSGVSFTAALLHDIGKLLMAQVFGEKEMGRVYALVQEKQCSWADAEKELFGFTHGDVGAHVAQQWKLPEQIETAIRNHHNSMVDHSPVTDSVRVANVVARAIGEGIGYEGMSVAMDSDIAERLAMSRENFESLCAATAGRMAEVLALYESA